MTSRLVRPPRVLGTLALASAAACAPTEPCDLCTTSALVYGDVRDAAGAPVPRAEVRVEAYSADTSRGQRDVLAGGTNLPLRTTSAGRYRDLSLSLSEPFRARLVVRVTPPAGSGLAAVSVGGVQVEFRADYRGPARDSVRVDVVLPPAATP